MTPRFCKDCRYAERYHLSFGEFIGPRCAIEPRETMHPIHGRVELRVSVMERNKAFDCALFEPVGPRSEPETTVEPEPKRPWWRRLW